jgi:hypothetical protein
MRTIWRDDIASYAGGFTSFDSIRVHPRPTEAGRLAELGVDELVLVASPPQDPAGVAQWLADLATDWQ